MSTSLYIVQHMLDHHPHQLDEAVNLADAEKGIHESALEHIEFEREQAFRGWPISPVENEDWVIHHYLIDGFDITHRMRHYGYAVLTGVRPLPWGPASVVDDEGWVVFK